MTAQGTRRPKAPIGSPQHSAISGRAEQQATRSYASRFASAFADDFYRETAPALTVSSIGMGTYLGECDDAEDERYTNTLAAGISNGLNLLDTAINYRCQRSELAVGRALQKAVRSGDAVREEIVVCTKGGYIPLVGSPPETRDAYRSYLESEYFEPGIMSPAEVVAGGHCLKPGFLANQIERSRGNLGVACIDIFYLHNPEQQLNVLSRAQFLDAIREAFAKLEALVADGVIGCYGCATWNGFRVFAASKNYLSLSELIAVAVEVGGKDHHFRVVQLPINLAMTEGVRSLTQHDGSTNLPLVEMAKDCGVSVVASASLMQSQLTRDLPPAVENMYPGLETDAQRAIAFVRSLPVASALVGMRSSEHLRDNLRSARAAPAPAIRS
jgi:aryl-alcohol dehydrogenase-like predicted oxidoreductase